MKTSKVTPFTDRLSIDQLKESKYRVNYQGHTFTVSFGEHPLSLKYSPYNRIACSRCRIIGDMYKKASTEALCKSDGILDVRYLNDRERVEAQTALTLALYIINQDTEALARSVIAEYFNREKSK